MSKAPKVSIVTITYNHKDYIRESLDSFIAQKTNFEYEIVIADDCSTDGTQEIIQEYVHKYPKLIRATLRNKNIGAVPNSLDSIRQAKGEYVALCEGDDFFTDPNKLQTQVNMLDSNLGLSLCFHKVRVFFDNGAQPDSVHPDLTASKKFNLENLLKTNFIQTNSVMYRRRKYDSIPEDILPLDWFLHLYHAQYGDIGFINKVMSAYRRHVGGMWWETSQGNIDEVWKRYGVSHIKLYIELLKIYGDTPQYRNIIDNHIAGTINAVRRIDSEQKSKLLQNYIDSSSMQNVATILILSLSRAVETKEENIEDTRKNIKILEEKLREKSERVAHLELEKEDILNSRTYRVGKKISKVSNAMRIKK